MKKIILLFVLAAAACTNLGAQNKLDRFFNKVDRTMAEMDRVEKSMKNLERAVGIKERRGYRKTQRDYQTGITTEYRGGVVSSIYCSNVWVEIYENHVSVYELTRNGQWRSSRFIPRDQYGEFSVCGAICGVRENVTIKITNNRERTMIWFWWGDKVIKGFTVRASYMQSHKH